MTRRGTAAWRPTRLPTLRSVIFWLIVLALTAAVFWGEVHFGG